VWIVRNPVKVAMMAIWGYHLGLLKVLVEDRKVVSLGSLVAAGRSVGPYTIAAQNGNLEMVKFLYRYGCPPGDLASIFEHAIRLGNLEMIRFVYDFHLRALIGEERFTVGTKNIDVWRWFWDLGVEKFPGKRTKIFPLVTNARDAQTVVDIMGKGKVDATTLKACAYQGNPSVFSILWSQRNVASLDSEIANLGFLPAMVKLAETCCENEDIHYPSTPEAIRLVHRYGSPKCSIIDCIRDSIDYVQQLVENCTCTNLEWSSDVLATATEHGLFEHVVFLQQVRPQIECTTRAMNLAAGNGHLDIVRFLHENRQEGCTTYAMDKAASNGHLDVVKFLHENRQEGCTTAAMDGAAHRGFLSVVRYLFLNRKEGCSPDAVYNVCDAMGFGGDDNDDGQFDDDDDDDNDDADCDDNDDSDPDIDDDEQFDDVGVQSSNGG
ncbi:hypothetical protein HDU76_011172, partial [Blyttiomyces sp. JEL0837]